MAKAGRPKTPAKRSTALTRAEQGKADILCDMLADGLSVREACKKDGTPGRSTFNRWLADERNEALRDQYARACDMRAEELFDEIFEIADDAQNDWMERNGEDDEGWQVNGEHLQRSRLRVDTRKWALSKMQPKKYGDKLDVDHKGDVNVILGSDVRKL